MGEGHKPAVLLFRGRGFVSRLIQWQTRGEFSHAALLMRDGSIVESWQTSGVRVKRLTDWQDVHKFDVCGMTDEQWDVAIEFALGQVGKPYDWLAIARFVDRANMTDNGKWFCSELVTAALNHANVWPLSRISPWAVSPALLSLSPMLVPVL